MEQNLIAYLSAVAKAMAAGGYQDARGKPPSAATLARAWSRIRAGRAKPSVAHRAPGAKFALGNPNCPLARAYIAACYYGAANLPRPWDQRLDDRSRRSAATAALLVQCRCNARRRRLVLVLPRATVVERGARAKGLAVLDVPSAGAPSTRGRVGDADGISALIATPVGPDTYAAPAPIRRSICALIRAMSIS
jgi:hypothetical protein